jgi:hypothetical protein
MVLGYSLRGGQAGLEAIASRFVVSLNFSKSEQNQRDARKSRFLISIYL